MIVPIKVHGELASLELIDEAGRKSALAGGVKRGGYWAAQALPEGGGGGLTLALGEGVATCLSAFEASGHPVVAALSSANLEAVAQYLRARFPDAKLIILADLSKGTGEPDPHAIAAARAVDGKLAVPEFGSPRSEGQTDFNDLHQALGLDAVRVCIEQAQGVESDRVETAKKLSDIAPGDADESSPWPVLPEAALVGVVGDIVRLATKDSEVDPAAVLLTTLARAGITIGANVYTSVGDTRHPPRLFSVLVGASGRARKGTSFDPVERIFRAAHARLSANGNAPDPLRLALTVSYGPLSSGEVYAVRDESETQKDGNPVDPGVADKRLFVIEGEFGAVLKAVQREGNTLSAILRSAWDHGNIAPLTKHNRIRATGAHVGFVGHITHQELETLLQTSDIWNGFANRILWGVVRRTGRVPFPQPIADGDLADIAASLAECLRCVCGNPDHPRTFDRIAASKWTAIYDTLTEDRPSALGAVTSRAEAQVLRLALLYSLLDPHASMIGIQHLKAAVAVWQFCDESARYIFGQAETDPDANRIVEAIQERGEMTSTEINKLFQGHVSSRRIRDILQRLQAYGKLTARTAGGGRQGKAKTIWVKAK